MKRSDVFPSNWLSAGDLDGHDVTLTVDTVQMEKLKDPKSGEESEKPVVYWLEEDFKPMVLNVTNWKSIEKLNGSEDSDDWHGQKVTVFGTEVTAFGETKQAIRVRTAPVRRPSARPLAGKPSRVAGPGGEAEEPPTQVES